MIQLRKALLQAALDNGSWDRTALLIPIPDPMKRQEFVGDPKESRVIAFWSKALQELKKGGKSNSRTTDDDDAADDTEDEEKRKKIREKRKKEREKKKKKEDERKAKGLGLPLGEKY